MRLDTTILFTLAVLSGTHAFVIPLERITSGPVPTNRSLSKRHEWRHGHGHHRQYEQGNEQGQQGQGDQHGQEGNDGQQGQDKQQEQNVVTVYTTVTGSPPQATPAENGAPAECEGGTEDEETSEAPASPPGPEENPPAGQGESELVEEQAKAPSEPEEQTHDPPFEGPPAPGGQNSGEQGKQVAHANKQSDHGPSAQDNPSPEEGKQGAKDGEPGNLKQPDSQPITAANAGDMNSQAQPEDSGDSRDHMPAKEEDSGDAKKQDSPNGKPGDNPQSDKDSSSGTSHFEVPDSPVPDAKKPEGKPTGGNVLTSDEQQKVLALHNAIREANGVPKLEWDDKLAKFSAGWTNKCVAHSEHSGGDKYGENMAGAGGEKPDPVGFVKMWTDEQSAFQCRKPADNEFHVVGHYTALMWKEVKYVGCSLQECTTMGDGDKSMPWHWTCNYWPPPNMMSGEEDAYKKNVPCSKNKPDELS